MKDSSVIISRDAVLISLLVDSFQIYIFYFKASQALRVFLKSHNHNFYSKLLSHLTKISMIFPFPEQ